MIEPRWGCTSWEGDHKETVYVVCVFVSKQEQQGSSHPFDEIARNRQETTWTVTPRNFPTFLGQPLCTFKMTIIDWIVRLFSQNPRQKQLSNLELLPRELLLHINNFLTTADIICLRLCSRTLNHFTTSFYDLKQTRDRSLALSVFTRLLRDSPRMFCCHYCAKLHLITDVFHPASSKDLHHACPDLGILHGNGPQPWIRWIVSVHCLPTHYDFRHCHLAAVLQNYKCGGQYGINAESLAYTEVVDYPQQPAISTLLSVEGRVCTPAGARQTPSLVLQIQHWVLFHDLEMVSGNDLDVLISVLAKLSICNWLSAGRGKIGDDIQSAIRQRGFCWDEASIAEGYMRCSHCGVEFQIALRDCGGDGKAVVITKWLDLGAGMDIEDPKWKKATFNSMIEPIYERADAMSSTGEIILDGETIPLGNVEVLGIYVLSIPSLVLNLR
ncbi:hypothetical protein ASPNIDRAFT_37944 [Aspergillus niger ATCC 1015]|uniref:F-box domain-containing protein n=1 Tax=Aspergillus niger (strain ATCC 1015 / CBS 113.46 / FGSC A1144 / LSHB Ac4 / NCTC 3858a / NRRL 328 / USDA 3528.7) TaxID=380704 RepID=G3YFE2_ASPNA|nr:hypothetical protein ASPNIDRAFT_37944 [Aspergillus niger ATCC 1015]